ncbi:MAG: polyphosphate polymerase domain-containing protein [Lachnospiraceae bacterium]|nr:polyphosphate polymerase domain-containing protein [Lachnospiraceae bacterium]
MNDKIEKKYRNEIKYLCSDMQLALIEARIKNICHRDSHAGEQGTYTVRSVYFDDVANSCFYENIDGVDAREKMRIRIYDGNMDYITLECKEKRNGKNHKESSRLSREQCDALLKGEYCPREEDSELIQKFAAQQKTKLMKPKVIVEYQRTPYVYQAGNVRITFDRNISAGGRIEEFGKKEIHLQPVLTSGYHILEVKYDEFFPEFIRREMELSMLRHTAFSKYVMCRKKIGL